MIKYSNLLTAAVTCCLDPYDENERPWLALLISLSLGKIQLLHPVRHHELTGNLSGNSGKKTKRQALCLDSVLPLCMQHACTEEGQTRTYVNVCDDGRVRWLCGVAKTVSISKESSVMTNQ